VSLLDRRYGSWVRNRSIVCPGWVDTRRFSPAQDKQVLRKSLPHPWQTDEPILLSVRRLESRMGLDTLIEAVALLADKHPVRVLIGGSGPEGPLLKDAIAARGLQDRVFLLGRIPEEQLAACYAAADAFVLPTRSLECFGLIVLEAFASGTPVIGAHVGAIPELLSEVGEDWMFTSGDPQSLATCIGQFLQQRLPLTVDLREIANQYDQRELMPRWIDLCVGTALPVSSLSEVK
jgi:glycosyltransferase involved in cell wall biosynthesis